MGDAATQPATSIIGRAIALERARKRNIEVVPMYIRLPDELHTWLVGRAAREGVSLNGLVTSVFSIVRVDDLAGRP